MSKNKDEEHISRAIYRIYANESPKTTAYIIQRSATFSAPMKRPVRPVFVAVLLIVLAATFGCRFGFLNGFGTNYGNVVIRSEENSVSDFPLFDSTLLKLAEIELGEAKLSKEIEKLLEGRFYNPAWFRAFASRRWSFKSGDIRGRTLTGVPVNLRSPEFAGVWDLFSQSLSDWSAKKKLHPDIMEELVDDIKVRIDNDNKKYSSCAVVGNSGILLSKEYGGLIDSHEAVIRLNNAKIESYENNVGSKTSISFVNSNILHTCASNEDCFCHPYGTSVPIVMYMCQPAQFLDYVLCNSSHKSPLIVTDPRLDMLCSRIVNYYSLKRYADGESSDKNLEEWQLSHDGSYFHYSSGMQAVTLALGICDRVSLFGFGKSNETKHHYHTDQKQELRSHDYQAEYDFYHDLVKKPHAIPFFFEKFEFPPVEIHR